jgi:hypothetical protein
LHGALDGLGGVGIGYANEDVIRVELPQQLATRRLVGCRAAAEAGFRRDGRSSSSSSCSSSSSILAMQCPAPHQIDHLAQLAGQMRTRLVGGILRRAPLRAHCSVSVVSRSFHPRRGCSWQTDTRKNKDHDAGARPAAIASDQRQTGLASDGDKCSAVSARAAP